MILKNTQKSLPFFKPKQNIFIDICPFIFFSILCEWSTEAPVELFSFQWKPPSVSANANTEKQPFWEKGLRGLRLRIRSGLLFTQGQVYQKYSKLEAKDL